VIVDANLLIYNADGTSPHHRAAAAWFASALNGAQRVGLPWQSIGAFLRIVTNRRLTPAPRSAAEAWAEVERWLAEPMTWIPAATERTAVILGDLVQRHNVTADRVPDAQLAALAIEHGVVLYSADTDFARFDELRWVNPLKGR